MDTTKFRGPRLNKRFWTDEDDIELIESLLEIHNEEKFKAFGNFKAGYLKAIETLLARKYYSTLDFIIFISSINYKNYFYIT